MEIRYSITLHPLVISHDIPALDTFWRQAVRGAIRGKLTIRPDAYGKPLRQTLKGCWSLRVGDYRVVFQVQAKTVRIVGVVHRSTDYEGLEHRLGLK